MSEPIGKIKTQKSSPNYTYSILSVALVLFLLGFFGLVALHANKLVHLMKEQVNILVELKPSAKPEEIRAVKTAIENIEFTKAGSVVLISKETAMKELKSELGEDFLAFDLQNPLYDMIRFNAKGDHLSSDLLQNVKKQLQLNESVNEVYFQEGLVDKISQNIEKIGWFAIASGFLLLFVALMLIHNTIKLALYANRLIIKNMELVGASWGFISRPYLKKGLINGFWSATIAIILLLGLLFLVQRELPELSQLSDWPSLSILFGALMLMGIFITGISTYYVVNKYLKMRLDDLY